MLSVFQSNYLETLSIPEKALKMLLEIFGNVNPAVKLLRIFRILFAQVINKHLRLNASINLHY